MNSFRTSNLVGETGRSTVSGGRTFQGTLRNQVGTSRFFGNTETENIEEMEEEDDEDETPSAVFQESSSVY